MIKTKDNTTKYIVFRKYTTEIQEEFISTIGYFDNEKDSSDFTKMIKEEHDRCIFELANINPTNTTEEEYNEKCDLIKNKYFPCKYRPYHLDCSFHFYIQEAPEIDMFKEIAIWKLGR